MFLVIVALCLAAFVVLCWMMSDQIARIMRWQKKSHERISKLEIHEHKQDARLDKQQTIIQMVRKDVHLLGKDLGWSDNGTKTQKYETPKKPPDEAE